MAFLTGSFGPTRHYPAFLRAIGDVLPLKYFIDIMNAVYLRGHAIWTKPAAIGVLAAWGATGLVVAALKFRWEPRESLIGRARIAFRVHGARRARRSRCASTSACSPAATRRRPRSTTSRARCTRRRVVHDHRRGAARVRQRRRDLGAPGRDRDRPPSTWTPSSTTSASGSSRRAERWADDVHRARTELGELDSEL